MDRIKVAIADDEPFVRAALREYLSVSPEFHVVGEAADGDDALQLVRWEAQIAGVEERFEKIAVARLERRGQPDDGDIRLFGSGDDVAEARRFFRIYLLQIKPRPVLERKDRQFPRRAVLE